MDLSDRRLARIVRRCQELPGQELFQYIGEYGVPCSVNSSDVNDYLRATAGVNLTAKDFRTWAGTVLAARALAGGGMFASKTQAKRNVVRTIENVAQALRNTPAVCRKCYIHPAIVNSYLDGILTEIADQQARHAVNGRAASYRQTKPL